MIDWNLALEVFGTIIGLFYLYYEYKAHRMLWAMGIIMPAVSLGVYYNAGLYADMGINIYYILAGIYGYVVWTFKNKRRREVSLPITHTPRRTYIYSTAITICIFALIYNILLHYTDSTVPAWDALSTALSITAMWMLARKYIEQWAVWIIVDIISVGLYIYKGIYFYAGLYALYIVIAVLGYINWLKIMKNEHNRPL
ncbi:MAG: nicotinamide mononucleotide transporter [Bacteroidaceae bacterium]|nr:nicotinamide mononucleotide transporter [Bacteroidaceae bacterium]